VDDAPLDERTAERLRDLRVDCAWPIAGVHGSLEGRLDGSPIVALEPDGRHAAVVTADTLERWDLDRIERVGRWAATLPTLARRVASVGETPAGLRVADATTLWRPNPRGDAWEVVATWEDDADAPAAPDVLLVSEGPALRALDFVRGRTRWRALVASAMRYDVVFSWGGRACLRHVPGGSFEVVEIVDFPVAGRTLTEARVAARLATPGRRPRGGPSFGTLHARTKQVAMATAKGVLLGRWDDWTSGTAIPDTPTDPWDMTFTRDGGTLVIFERERVLRVDAATRAVRVARGTQRNTAMKGVALAASSGRVVCVANGVLEVLDPDAESFRARAHDPIGPITCAVGSRDGRALVTGAADGTVRVRDRATGETLTHAEAGPDAHVCDVTLSADDREVISLTLSGTVLRLERATGALVGRIDASEPSPGRLAAARGSLALDADGRRAVMYGADRSVTSLRMVDLVREAWQSLPAIAADAGDASQVVDLRFVAPGLLRVATQHTLTADGAGQEARCLDLALDGGAPRIALRWPIDEREDVYDSVEHLLSEDGRLLWRVGWARGVGTHVAVVAVDEGLPSERTWTLGRGDVRWRVGRSLLAAANAYGTLWIVAASGPVAETPWPGAREPLAFAHDEHALWVLDASGIVVEVAVPASLVAASASPTSLGARGGAVR
jgi:hypothetical protein